MEGGPAQPATADKRLEQIETGKLIERAIRALKPEVRSIVVLREYQGLSYQEISQAVAVPIGTVRSRIHRGRKILKEVLV